MARPRAITGQKLGLFARAGAGLAVCGVAGLVLTGCPTGGTLENPECYEAGQCGTGGSGSGGGGSVACDAVPILATNCKGSFCHGTAGTPPLVALVDLVNPAPNMTMAQTLFNLPATYPTASTSPGECPPAAGAELIIDGADASRSLLSNKVAGALGTDFSCGDEMTGTPAITAAERDCIVQWVGQVVATGGQ